MNKCKLGLSLKKCCITCRGCTSTPGTWPLKQKEPAKCKTCDPLLAREDPSYFSCWKKKIVTQEIYCTNICEYCEGCIDLVPKNNYSCFMGRRMKDIG